MYLGSGDNGTGGDGDGEYGIGHVGQIDDVDGDGFVNDYIGAVTEEDEFRTEAYFEIYSIGGELVDLGVKAEVIEKAGSWYSYQDERIGQGRENVKQYLEDHPEVAEKIALEIKSSLGLIKELEESDLIEDQEIDKTVKSSE